MRKAGILLVMVSGLCLSRATAIDASRFHELVGYTVLTCTNAAGEVEGADFDKLIKLDNGMVFEFETYDYFYAYHPDVVVFAKTVQTSQGKSVTLYKLVIEDEDEVFDVHRVR
jgi:hypothetical protein